MITKLLSFLLSFSIIFMSVAPSYAQARSSAERYRSTYSVPEDLDRNIARRIAEQNVAVQDMTDPNRFAHFHSIMLEEEDLRARAIIEQKLQEAYDSLTAVKDEADGEAADEHLMDYNEFKSAYLENLEKEERSLVRQAKSKEEQLFIQNQFKSFREDSAVRESYLQAEEALRKDILADPQKYQNQIFRPIIDLALNNLPTSKAARDLIPVMASYGLLNPQDRKQSALFFRKRLEVFSESCGKLSLWSSLKSSTVERAQSGCEAALSAASSLSVVGEVFDNDSQDALALYDFLLAGYNGIAAPMVVQVAAQGLLALNAEHLLGGAVTIISKKLPFTPIDVSLSMLSVQTYVELFQVLANSEGGFGTATFAEGLEYSFYSHPDPSFGNKRNMWVDLGQTLAQMANDPQEDRQAQIAQALDQVLEECIGPDSRGNLSVKFRPFVVGALSGGYDVSLQTPRTRQEFTRDGKVRTVEPNAEAWSKLRNWIRSTGFTNTQYISWYLYSLKKIDLDPSTEQYMNNLLTAAFVGSARRAGQTLEPEEVGNAKRYVIGYGENHTPLVMVRRSKASAEAIASHENRQKWIKIGIGADIVITVFALVSLAKLGFNLAKWGADMLRTSTRVLKLARAGQLAAGGSLGANAVRVISRARAIRHLPSMRSVISGSVANAAGIRRMEIKPLIKEFRGARKIRIRKPKSAPLKSQVRTLNGEQYLVFEGTETAYVQGRVVYVDKGETLASVARKYNVPESQVAWASDGSFWLSSEPVFNFGAGEAVAGSRGVQPVMARPSIQIPKPLSSVEPVKPAADASLVKSGEKLAYIRENGVWRIESVPQKLSRAEVANRFKVGVDDVDYVVSLSDGTLAPEWAEFSEVWDVMRMPSVKFKKLEFTQGDLFKARLKVGLSDFKNNLSSFFGYTVRHPFRAAGMGTTAFSLGGVVPVETAIVAEAPAFARSFSASEWLGGLSKAPLAVRSASAVPASSVSTMELAGSAANLGVHSGTIFLNPFWLLGGVTSPDITPVGAISSADTRRNSIRRSFGWERPVAFTQYQQQLNNWLFRSNPLYRAQQPWALGHWWEDAKNSVSLGWQEFNLSRAANPYYVDFKASLRAAPALSTAEEPAAPAVQPALPPAAVAASPVSTSGYLYSGLPVMQLQNASSSIWKTLRGMFGKKADVLAEDVLRRKVPLVTELRDIVTGSASVSLKQQALVRLHQQFNAFDSVIKQLPASAQLTLHSLEELGDNAEIGRYLYSLYDAGYFSKTLPLLNNHIPVDDLAQQLASLQASPEFDATRRAVYDKTLVLSAASNAFTGVVKSLQDVDTASLIAASRPAGWAAQNASDGKEVSGGWVYYENDIPVYYRSSKGELSATPVIILSQPPFSAFSALLASLHWTGLSTRKGIKVPKGMVLAIDENGKFKFVLQQGHRREMEYSQATREVMSSVYKDGAYAVEVDTPYSTTDLLAVAKLLEQGTDLNFQLTLNAPNSFKAFVNLLGSFFGLNVDSTMVGPFKDAAKAVESPVIKSVAPNAFGGVGYVTPRIAGELTPLMQKWGMEKSVFTVLSVSLFTLLTYVALGLDGFHPIKDFSLVTLALPMVVLVLSASLLRGAAPLLLNHYKDPRQRTAANLRMSSYQQGAKVLLAFITAVWPFAGEKFVAVPAAALLAALTLGLFFNTFMGKKVWDGFITAITHPRDSLAALVKGIALLTPKLLTGLVTGVAAPVIAVGTGAMSQMKKLFSSKSKSGTAVRGNTKQDPYQREFEQDFLADPDTKNSRMRVTAAYASYAASIMLLNQVATTYLNEWWGQAAVTAFALASLVVRLKATGWIAAGRYSDDQLTGISFAGLTLMPLVMAVLPYDELYGILGVVLAGIGLNMSTAVPGQLDNTRLQNNVTAKIQERKNKVLQDPSLSESEKEVKLADLESMERHWAAQASKVYNKANANGIYGVYAAVIASLIFPFITGNWSWIARTVFLYSASVAAFGAWKTKDQAFSFAKAMFSKKKRLVVTDEDIAGNKVSAATFGLVDKKKASQLIPALEKGKGVFSLKVLQEQVAPYGVIAIASEVKLTKVLKRMIEIHNRFVASAELLGNASLEASFEKLHSLAKDYSAVMEKSNVSVSLRREFNNFAAALCMDGDLEKGVLEKPSYMREGEFDIPANYRNLLEARDIILEMEVLVRNIKQGGSAVSQDTYRLFIQYHTEAKQLLQAYMAKNPSESAIVKTEEARIAALCRDLKEQNARNNLLRTNAGQTSAKDVQDLEDILQVYD